MFLEFVIDTPACSAINALRGCPFLCYQDRCAKPQAKLLGEQNHDIGSAFSLQDQRHAQYGEFLFVTINTGIVAAIGYFQKTSNLQNLAVIFAGALICCVRYRLMVSYRQINTGKFKVIHEMDKQLPLAVFDAEWDALGRGEDAKLYRQFTVIEAAVPLIFRILYGALFVRGLRLPIWDELPAE